MKINTKRIHETACALKAVIGWLEQSRHHHPQSGVGQMCDKWRKDADWLKRIAKRIGNSRDKEPPRRRPASAGPENGGAGNPFSMTERREPLPDLTIEQAQAALDESVARRRHDDEYEQMRNQNHD